MNPKLSTLRLQIVTPEARVFEGDATLVELPTVEDDLARLRIEFARGKKKGAPIKRHAV